MSEQTMKYEDAMKRLEELTARMERGDVAIDEMADCLREAQKLVASCRAQLTEAEKNCNSLLQDGGNVEEND